MWLKEAECPTDEILTPLCFVPAMESLPCAETLQVVIGCRQCGRSDSCVIVKHWPRVLHIVLGGVSCNRHQEIDKQGFKLTEHLKTAGGETLRREECHQTGGSWREPDCTGRTHRRLLLCAGVGDSGCCRARVS